MTKELISELKNAKQEMERITLQLVTALQQLNTLKDEINEKFQDLEYVKAKSDQYEDDINQIKTRLDKIEGKSPNSDENILNLVQIKTALKDLKINIEKLPSKEEMQSTISQKLGNLENNLSGRIGSLDNNLSGRIQSLESKNSQIDRQTGSFITKDI